MMSHTTYTPSAETRAVARDAIAEGRLSDAAALLDGWAQPSRSARRLDAVLRLRKAGEGQLADQLVERWGLLDAPRSWDLCEEGTWYDTITARSAREAMRVARENADASNYDWNRLQTLRLDLRVRCVATDEEDSDTVEIDPEEPDCEDGAEHDWEDGQAFGNGGGIIVTDTCRTCGCQRRTNTWATDPTNGQHYTCVSYGQDADEVW